MNENLTAYAWLNEIEIEIEIVQPFDWWDGPLTGLAKYRNSEHWFEFQYEEDIEGATSQYHYVLYKLTDEQMSKVKDALKNQHGKHGVNREWESLDLTGAEAIGRFKSGGNSDLYAIKVV